MADRELASCRGSRVGEACTGKSETGNNNRRHSPTDTSGEEIQLNTRTLGIDEIRETNIH